MKTTVTLSSLIMIGAPGAAQTPAPRGVLPGLLPALQVLGAVLVFIQVALAVDTMLAALRALGVTAR